ncbi:MAG: sorbosone dehydrogenase family protein [Alphaproteobacteria bacterium]|nr:sorbosone dehydrogenase family protein [Alphaproteobacteria bacterium]
MDGKARLCLAVLSSAALLCAAALAADHPGQHFQVLSADMPQPYATPGVDNHSTVIPRPAGALPEVPKGFTIEPYITGLDEPRFMALAPNGDVFLAEPHTGSVLLLRGKQVSTFATGFNMPHGLAFHDGALYVGDLNAVWRVGYADGGLTAGPRAAVTKDPFGGRGNHWTRDIAFGPNGTLYVAIGSASNVAEDPNPRATVQKVMPDGHLQTFASGIRNPVGIAFYPGTNDLYVTVNERDGLGDELPPDYFTQIRQGDFFGWPYAYIGPHPDPVFGKKRPDLVAKAKVPDVLFRAHSAPLGLVFYEGSQFPESYKGDAFIALHGSWDSAKPTGYKIVTVKFKDGKPENGYENFVTGFRNGDTSPPQVWGRPAGLVVTKDGSLLIADDAGNTLWRVRYVVGK